MRKQKHYVLIKKSDKKQIFYIDYDKLEGYEMKPRNQVKYDGIIVNKLIMINPSFIEKILVKKTKRRLEQYLQYIIDIMEDDSNATPGELKIALNRLEKYRRTVINTYRKYLDEKYYKLLLQKIDLIEQELTKKMFIISSRDYFKVDSKEFEPEKKRKAR